MGAKALLISASLVILILEFAAAQDILKLDRAETIPAGTDLISNTVINCQKQAFPYSIYQIEIDTVHSEALIVTRKSNGKYYKNDGALFVYSPGIQHSSFAVPIFLQFNVDYTDSAILVGGLSKFVYNRKTQTKTMRNQQTLVYLNRKFNIGINDKLEAIDLLNGSSLWKSDLKLEQVKEVITVSDSVILLNADGVYKINIFNGKSWSYSAVTSAKNTGSAIAKWVFAGSLYMNTGFTPSNGIKSGKINGLSSNIYLSDRKIFYASKNSVVCLNADTGKILWEVPLPEASMSNADIRVYKDIVVLTSSGFAVSPQGYVKMGIPFIAGFDPTNGKQLYFTGLPENSNLVEHKVANDRIYLIYSDKIICYDYLTGRAYHPDAVKMTPNSSFTYLFKSKLLYSADKEHTGYLTAEHSSDICIVNRDEKNIYVFTPDLNAYEVVDSNKAFLCLAIHPTGVKYVYNGVSDSSYLIDKTGKIVADLKMGFSVQLCGDFIIENKNTSISVLDLTPFLPK